MIIDSEQVNFSTHKPSVGDTILIKNKSYEVVCTRMGYRLVCDGKMNMSVGIHETLKTFVDAIREQNQWNTPRSLQRGQALNV